MPEKKTYTQVVTEILTEIGQIKTHGEYTANHLGNIDKHLERQNGRLTDHDKATSSNKTNVRNLWAAIAGMFTAVLALGLKLIGVY